MSTTLTDDQIRVIRRALLTALEATGGGVEPEDDPALSPGLSDRTRDLETMLREAIRLIDQATLPAG